MWRRKQDQSIKKRFPLRLSLRCSLFGVTWFEVGGPDLLRLELKFLCVCGDVQGGIDGECGARSKIRASKNGSRDAGNKFRASKNGSRDAETRIKASTLVSTMHEGHSEHQNTAFVTQETNSEHQQHQQPAASAAASAVSNPSSTSTNNIGITTSLSRMTTMTIGMSIN